MPNENEIIMKDVIVVGGGMAGVSAAISAAENGADVLLLDQLSCLGGTATAGMVTPMMTGGIYADNGKKVVSGNMDKIFDHMNKYEETSNYNFNPEILKYVLDEMLLERNVDILFNTYIYDVEKQNGCIKNLVGINKSGVGKYCAKVYIDTSGDADIAYKAGIHCKTGRDNDGLTQASTLRFIISNVDAKRAKEYMSSREGRENFKNAIKSYSESTGFEILDSEEFQNFIINGRTNELVFNCPRVIGIDATDSKSLTKAYVEGRRKILVYFQLLKGNVPGCENSHISNIAGLLGIRESRRICGDYVLSGEDVIKGRKFNDGIACNAWYIDIHNPTGKGILGYKGKSEKIQYPEGGWNDIPYRCLYSNQVKNLLVAGRCISTTHEAQAAVRIMASCIAMGQAAGTAASLMAEKNISVDKVDAQLLRERLANDGALISGINL